MQKRQRVIILCGCLAALAGSALLLSASGKYPTVHDKAYYADANLVNFVRPGLVIKVTAAEIATDGTVKARVRLTDPKGLPLDREGVTTPGAVSVSFIAAYIPKGQAQYVSYTTRPQNSPITGRSEIQASADSGGTFVKTAEGEYVYTFKTHAPQGFDRTVTHSIGAYGSRNLTEFDMGTQYDDDVFNFVPDGSAVTVVRDVIRTASCNKCHDQMAFHGGSRRTMELCNLCHTPQTIDPDTGNTLDMKVMTHKIHMGSGLPTVEAGGKYQIIGHNQTVADYSKIVFPADARNCVACHEAGGTQHDNMYKPSRAACGSCHDTVNFDTGAGHVDLPQPTDNMCATCHIKQGEQEFDASIIGAHTVPRLAPSLPGVMLDILAVDKAEPGKQPVVTFSLKDKAGNPIAPSTMYRLQLVLAGPNSDYASYLTEDVRKAEGAGDGRFFWTMSKPLPADAKGSYSLGIEARREVKLQPGTKKEITVRQPGINKVFYFAVDGTPMEKRRTVVTTEKCNACHFSLSFHGDGRNQVQQCVLCHNPNLMADDVTVDFKTMIHRIHTGHELERPYVIGNSNFSEVGYPGDRRNCSACHVNGSEQLPMSAGALPVKEPASPMDPLPPTTAACTGCHSSLAALSHAKANTTSLGESCSVCHGVNADNSVNRAHAR